MKYYFTSIISETGTKQLGVVQVQTANKDDVPDLVRAVVEKVAPEITVTNFQAKTYEMVEKEDLDVDRFYTTDELKTMGY